LIIFLCSIYHYIIYTHSRSNVSSTYYISKKYLKNLTFNIPKIDFSNPAKLSGSSGIFAGAEFGKSTRFRPEPKSSTALVKINITYTESDSPSSCICAVYRK